MWSAVYSKQRSRVGSAAGWKALGLAEGAGWCATIGGQGDGGIPVEMPAWAGPIQVSG